MNLIFVITKNEIRPFRSNDGKTVSKFHISGEEIYEYDECYDFAEDLKDKLLAILNMHDLSEVAVDIAYIKGENHAAEEMLREFMPCFRVQVGEFEKIEDYAETAEQMLCITDNRSVALGMELDIYRERFAKVEKRLVDAEKHIAEIDDEYQSLQKKHNELEINLKDMNLEKLKRYVYDAKYAHERFCCYFEFESRNSAEIDIDWKLSNGEVFSLEYHGDYVNLGTCSGKNARSSYIVNLPEDYCPVDTDYKDYNCRLECRNTYGGKTITLRLRYGDLVREDNWNVYSLDRYIKERKLIILKSNDIEEREIFAVITHPDDSEEAVKEWLKTKEGK